MKTSSLKVANKAIGWVHSNLHHFSPLQGDALYNEERVKPFCELALLCWLMVRLSCFADDKRIWSCLHLIRDTYNNHLFFDRLLWQPGAFAPYVLTAVALQKTGLLSTDELRVFQVLIDHSNVLFSERAPHRQLELRHIFDVGGFAYRLPSYKALYSASIASKQVNPIYITDLDAYSITHTLFYCSDFGTRGVLGASRQQLSHCHRCVEALLGIYTIRANWDLVAELLLCCHCLKQTSSLLYASVWKQLIQAQWESGLVPGPYYEPDKKSGLSDLQKADYVFRQCYHTTLVAALAGTLCDWNEDDHGLC
jgi:hypothetical protein